MPPRNVFVTVSGKFYFSNSNKKFNSHCENSLGTSLQCMRCHLSDQIKRATAIQLSWFRVFKYSLVDTALVRVYLKTV